MAKPPKSKLSIETLKHHEDRENLKCQTGISSSPAPESGGRRSGAMWSQIVTTCVLCPQLVNKTI